MRLILLLYLLTHTAAGLFGQSMLDRRIDFEVSSLAIEESLEKIEAEQNLSFSYSPKHIPKHIRLRFKLKDRPIREVLELILKNSSLQAKEFKGKILLVKRKIQRYNFSGYIEDAESGERLISARISCPKLKRGAHTNAYGFFSLKLEPGIHEVEFHYVGYQSIKRRIELKKDHHEVVSLGSNLELEEVIISPYKVGKQLAHEDENGHIELLPNFVRASPGLAGEADAIRSAQLLPGVQGGIDGLGGTLVRGGESGQNMMMLDGVPVYIPFHLLGVYSIYNNNTILSAKLMKGNFPAKYGGRLSSVFDVRTREGNRSKWSAEAGLNLTTIKATVEGPINKGKGSFLLSGRSSHSNFLLEDPLEQLYYQTDEDILFSDFGDLNIKFNYAFSPNDRVYLSFFRGSDFFTKLATYNNGTYANMESQFNWHNSIFSFRWNHLFNSRLFANTTITYSDYGFQYSSLEQYFEEADPDVFNPGSFEPPPTQFYFLNSLSENRDLGIKLDFDFLANENHTMNFGLGVFGREFIPDLTFFDEEYIPSTDIDTFSIDILTQYIQSSSYNTLEADAYLEDVWQINPDWRIRMGLRGSAFFNNFQPYYRLEPRFHLDYQYNKNLRFHASANRMVQYLHLVNNSAIRLPNDLWIPSSYRLRPQEAWQGEMGMRFQLNEHISLSGDIYYKKMENLYAYPDTFNIIQDVIRSNPEEYLVRGRGRAFGLETMISYEGENQGAMFSYTLSDSRRQYNGQNLGLRYAHEYDFRHQLKLFAYKKLAKNLQISINYLFFSPNPRLNLIAVPSGEGLRSLDLNPLGKKNFKRARPYSRFDVQMTYEILQKKWRHSFKAGLYNGLNQRNVAYYRLQFTQTQIEEGRPVYALPLLPSFSYTVKFN